MANKQMKKKSSTALVIKEIQIKAIISHGLHIHLNGYNGNHPNAKCWPSCGKTRTLFMTSGSIFILENEHYQRKLKISVSRA